MTLKNPNFYKPFATKVTSFIYNLLPKTLLLRFILIITIPTIIIQLIAIYLFYYRHWYNVSNYTSTLIVNEVKSLVQKYPTDSSLQNSSKYLNLDYSFLPNHKLQVHKLKQKKELKIFHSILQNEIYLPNIVDLVEEDNVIQVKVELENGLLIIHFNGKMLRSPTTYIFVMWILFLTFILLFIALTFSKNQIKSILELSKAASDFGQNIHSKNIYIPSGAREIRKTGIAFIRMKEKIERQIRKRTQLLAMISHDLKTPLTSLKLQLALLSEKQLADDMLYDVERMEQMIASYLDFARGEGGEPFKKVDIVKWFKRHTSKSKFQSLEIKYRRASSNLVIRVKEQAFKRAIDNILSNSSKYSSIALISIYSQEQNIVIDIEDNGSGIKDIDKDLVLKPFYRVDKSRNVNNNGNVGLGLSIAKEIILGHNGSIKLLDSHNLKGLLVRINIPKNN